MSFPKRKLNDQDPDYEDNSSQDVKRLRTLEEHARANVSQKISTIIQHEFKDELQRKEKEIDEIECRLDLARRQLHVLRYAIVSAYYNRKPQVVKKSETQQPTIHPAVKKLIGKQPKLYIKEEPDAVNFSHLAVGQSFDDSCSKEHEETAVENNENPANTEENKNEESSATKIPRYIPPNPKSTDVIIHSPPRGVRHKVKRRIVIGNISKWLPVDTREDKASHKWMLYVRGTRENPDISDCVSKIRVFLHPSYQPHDVVDVTSPPFHLVRRGWGEFPIRVQIHFSHPANKPVDVIHHLRLDKTYTGLQTLGAETVVDIWLFSNEKIPDSMEMISIETGSSVEHIKLVNVDDNSETANRSSQKENSVDPGGTNILLKPEISKEAVKNVSSISKGLVINSVSEESYNLKNSHLVNANVKEERVLVDPEESCDASESVRTRECTPHMFDHDYFYTAGENSVPSVEDVKCVEGVNGLGEEESNCNLNSEECNLRKAYSRNKAEDEDRDDNTVFTNNVDIGCEVTVNGLVSNQGILSKESKSAEPNNQCHVDKNATVVPPKLNSQRVTKLIKCVDSKGRVFYFPFVAVDQIVLPNQKKINVLPNLNPSVNNPGNGLQDRVSNLKCLKNLTSLAKAPNTSAAYPVSLLKVSSASISPFHQVQNSSNNYLSTSPKQVANSSVVNSSVSSESAIKDKKDKPIFLIKIPPNSLQGSVDLLNKVKNQKIYQTIVDGKTVTRPGVSLLKPRTILPKRVEKSTNMAEDHLSNSPSIFQEKDSDSQSDKYKKAAPQKISLDPSKYSCIEDAVEFLVRQMPLVSVKASHQVYKCAHPYAAASVSEFLEWNIGKQRAAEWFKSKTIQKILIESGFAKDSMWSTKEIMLWGRMHGYTPLPIMSDVSSSGSQTTFLKQCHTYSEPETVLEWLTERKEARDSEGEDEVDVVGTSLQRKVKVESTEDEDSSLSSGQSIIMELKPELQAPCLFVNETAREIGVQLTLEEIIPGVYYPAAERVLFEAVKSFAENILRRAFFKGWNRNNNRRPESLVLEDVCCVLLERPEFDLFTNEGLGVQIDHQR